MPLNAVVMLLVFAMPLLPLLPLFIIVSQSNTRSRHNCFFLKEAKIWKKQIFSVLRQL